MRGVSTARRIFVASFTAGFFFVANSSKAADEWKRETSWKPFGTRWALAYDESGHLSSIYDLGYPDWSKTLLLGKVAAPSKNPSARPDPSTQLTNIDHVLKDVKSILAEVEGPLLGQNFIPALQFEKTGDGSYMMKWNGSQLGEHHSGPRKLCDLRSEKWAFLQTAKVFAISTTLSTLTGISGPTVAGALVAEALDRFFHFYNLMLKTQQNMLLEALVSMKSQDSLYAKFQMSEEDRKLAMDALTFSQASLETSWKWEWTSPDQVRLRSLAQENENRRANEDWLNSHNVNVLPLNSRFALTLDANGEKKLVNLVSHRPSFDQGPTAPIDYSNPDGLRNDRISKQLEVATILFGTEFIPLGGFLVRYFYKMAAEKLTDVDLVWEGRLEVALEELQARLQKDFSQEINIIERERLNPLMDAETETSNLVAVRRQMIGL